MSDCFFGSDLGDASGDALGDLAIEDGFEGVALKFGANWLGRSLSVKRGDTFDLLRADFLVIDFVRDERGAYLI